jgi:hypothetical protein
VPVPVIEAIGRGETQTASRGPTRPWCSSVVPLSPFERCPTQRGRSVRFEPNGHEATGVDHSRRLGIPGYQ